MKTINSVSYNNIAATARNIESAICSAYCMQTNLNKLVRVEVWLSSVTKERWFGFIKREGNDFYLISRVVDKPILLEESWLVTNGFNLSRSTVKYDNETDSYELTITCKIAKN